MAKARTQDLTVKTKNSRFIFKDRQDKGETAFYTNLRQLQMFSLTHLKVLNQQFCKYDMSSYQCCSDALRVVVRPYSARR